jgi:hypothetical protein
MEPGDRHMDSNVAVALIGAAATIIAAIITGAYQRRHQHPEVRPTDLESERKARTQAPKARPENKPSEPGEAAKPGSACAARVEEEAAEETEAEEEVAKLAPGEEPPDGGSSDDGKPVPLACPSCGKRHLITPRLWFKKVRCKGCQSLFRPNPITGAERL